MTFTPQLVVALAAVAAVVVLAVAGTIGGDTAAGVVVSLLGAFGLGASHNQTATGGDSGARQGP